jgi:hypothetical protein
MDQKQLKGVVQRMDTGGKSVWLHEQLQSECFF